MSVLTDILQRTRRDLIIRKSQISVGELQRQVKDAPPVRSLRKALKSARFSIIAEIKRRSPSAGEMSQTNYDRAVAAYTKSPVVSALSVLTDEPFFGGSLAILKSIRRRWNKPILRKDFIIDEYQIWEARAAGADAILLMAAIHDGNKSRLHALFQQANELGLQCLMEIGMSHIPADEQRDMIPEEADIWGINSRQFDSPGFVMKHQVSKIWSPLRSIGPDVSITPSRHSDLRDLIPSGKLAVAESGMLHAEDLWPVMDRDYRAALIGTAFLRGPAPVDQTLTAFGGVINAARQNGLARAHG
jgi:indole-3-glycerol phosphate synthase